MPPNMGIVLHWKNKGLYKESFQPVAHEFLRNLLYRIIDLSTGRTNLTFTGWFTGHEAVGSCFFGLDQSVFIDSLLQQHSVY